MLIAYRFRNFRSFKDDAEISLVAHRADKSHSAALLNQPSGSRSSMQLLPAAAIYGANAAGKTNVLNALVEARHAIVSSHSKWEPERPILIDRFAEQSAAESDLMSFECEFFVGGVRYRYGFAADRWAFRDEWLYCHGRGKPNSLFSRSTTKNGIAKVRTGSAFVGESTYLGSIKARVRKNSLFLSAAAQENHPIARSIHEFFSGMFMSSLISGDDTPRTNLTSTFLDQGDIFREDIVPLIRAADPAIRDVRVRAKEGRGWADHMKSGGGGFFTDAERYDVTFLMADGDSTFEVDLSEQSLGVQKFYGLAGELYGALKQGKLVLVDELERSMHPLLARMVVDLFQNRSTNPERSQLIFTTHDTNLLDQDLLRRDQIWFVEKVLSTSHLYPLLDFSPRKDANLEVGYLRGKYGAIPLARVPEEWLTIPLANPTKQSRVM
jgi:hypothetical protein